MDLGSVVKPSAVISSPVEGDGQDGSFRATARRQGAGEHGSWVGGEPKQGDVESPVEGDGADGKLPSFPSRKKFH